MQQDFSMIQHDRAFMAIGAGEEVARGFLEAKIYSGYKTILAKEQYRENIIKECIKAVEKHCPTVL